MVGQKGNEGDSLDPIFKEEHEMVEEMAGGLYAPQDSGIRFPIAAATFQIDMTLTSEEDRQKIYQAESLLREAGVGFDAGSGGGYQDWELDWSLSGAFLRVKPIRCMVRIKVSCEKMGSHCYWAVFSRENGPGMAYSFCSAKHREDEIDKRKEDGWALLLKEESDVISPDAFPQKRQQAQES